MSHSQTHKVDTFLKLIFGILLNSVLGQAIDIERLLGDANRWDIELYANMTGTTKCPCMQDTIAVYHQELGP